MGLLKRSKAYRKPGTDPITDDMRRKAEAGMKKVNEKKTTEKDET